MTPNRHIAVHPLTPDRWDDLVTLFGRSGACGGCWCMFWRVSRAEFSANGNAGNREALHALVERGEQPGLLAFVDGVAAGWISLGPRERFGPLERSPKRKRIDDTPVWSIVCFYIARAYRHQGLSLALLAAARDFARAHGATTLEGYPALTDDGRRRSDDAVYMGVAEVFRRAGFVEVARPTARFAIMRAALE